MRSKRVFDVERQFDVGSVPELQAQNISSALITGARNRHVNRGVALPELAMYHEVLHKGREVFAADNGVWLVPDWEKTPPDRSVDMGES